jgi:D-alanyl-D-alanine carboxypeptidase
VTSQLGRFARSFMAMVIVSVAFALTASSLHAAPYAAIVMDARTGEILYSENDETRLHPASLTKMMTLYIVFEEIERGNLSLDTMVKISKHAAAQPPSKLGLRAGQKIALRYLIRAAAIKSANDAATAIGELVGGGSEIEFAKRMTRTAKALGMKSSTFKNANGLTAQGHLSSARDMSILGRHLFYDFPQYYNLFSRRSADAGMATVNNTNRRFLDAYKGADGIKTGYTNAAGFNLTASAERGGKRLIATVFGGKSTADRNAKMVKLLDLGFGKAPSNVPVTKPDAPAYQGGDAALVADNDLPEVEGGAGKTLRVQMAVLTSIRPRLRPVAAAPETIAATEVAVMAMQSDIEGALAEAFAPPPPEGTLEAQVADMAADADAETQTPLDVTEVALASSAGAVDVPSEEVLAAAVASAAEAAAAATPEPEPVQMAFAAPAPPAPPKRNAPIFDQTTARPKAKPAAPEVIVSVSSSGDRHWGVNVGRFGSRYDAERALLKTQLTESATLNASLRKVMPRGGGFDATFVGLTQDQADLACRRLQARAVQCFTMGP